MSTTPRVIRHVSVYHQFMRHDNCNMVMMGMHKTDKNGRQTELYKRGYVASWQNSDAGVGDYPESCWSHKYFSNEKDAIKFIKTK